MSIPDKPDDKCIVCDATLTYTEPNADSICKTCALAKRLMEPPKQGHLTSGAERSVAAAIVNGLLAGVVATTSWIALASLSMAPLFSMVLHHRRYDLISNKGKTTKQ